MKIALVHYHLKTGGVTSVLKGQIAALGGFCDLLVLTGDRAQTTLPCHVEEIPDLGYDSPGMPAPDPERAAKRIRAAISRLWPSGCDVLHIHNPTLAKNRSFLKIIKQLQKAGVNLFLQIHDFAEDGRPDAYFGENYPSNCHYGVINSRDKSLLLSAGLDESGLHLVLNPVPSIPSLKKAAAEKHMVLYPVRAIRRKNIGEAILLSMFISSPKRISITQPPISQADTGSYRDWIQWTEKHRLPVDFETGDSRDFSTIVDASHSMITTSINEGFGYCFLEPWVAGKGLWGRRIDTVCRDFEQNGICLDSLYHQLNVPLKWICTQGFFNTWRRAVLAAAERFGRKIFDDEIFSAFSRITKGKKVDFGLLGEKFQRHVLERLMARPRAKNELIRLNPFLSGPIPPDHEPDLIEANQRAVSAGYGMEKCRENLLAVYHKVIQTPVSHAVDRQALLDAFFDLRRFSLLKWAAYDG